MVEKLDEAYLLAGNICLVVLVLLEQYLGISACKSNCLLQFLFNNLRTKHVCMTEDEDIKVTAFLKQMKDDEARRSTETGRSASDSERGREIIELAPKT